MAASVTHAKVSAIPDAGDASLVEPSDWNAGHVLSGVQGTITLTTTGTSGPATLIADTLNIPNYADTDTGITQLTGEVTAGPGNGSQAATVTNSAVIAKVLTGYVSGAGTVSAADSILQAIQKLNGNDAGKQPLNANLTSWAAITRATGFDTFTATPSSANLRSLLTDESGTGLAYFQGGDLGTPSAGVATNLTGTAASLAVGSAAKWTTARNLAGNSVDGSANATFANKFIVQGTADAGLTAAQFLGALGTGLVKNTTTTGVLSIGVAGTDFQAPSANLTSWAAITRASGFDTFTATPSSANLRALLTDESGTGAAYFQGGDLGTPSAGVMTNATGTAASLTAGTATVANGLKTATTTVVISSATAPSSGQVLTATSSTAADWETPSTGGQPIPASSTFAIGTLIVGFNSSGGSIADGGTIAGASLHRATATGAVVTGTWTSVSGAAVGNGAGGYWVRTS